MKFEIDTGASIAEGPMPQSAMVESSQSLDLSDIVRAERIHRKIIANVQMFEHVKDLDAYWAAESVMLDAFYLSQHVLHAEMEKAYGEHRAMIACDRAPKLADANADPAEPGQNLSEKGNDMSFDFNDLSANAGSDGIVGPFINWQAKAGQHAQGKTWTLRVKSEENGSQVHDITENFKNGVIFDYNTIRLGWEEWAPMGQRPNVQWAPTPNLSAFPRPTDTKRTNEMGRQVFVWQKVFAIRVAVTPEQAGSWYQSAFGAMSGFEAFIEQLKVSGPQHVGMLPLVKFTGVTEGYGGAPIPTLTIADWRTAPKCLKQDLPVSGLSAGAKEEPAPAATPQAAPQATVTAGGF